jgi:hypothetical protein
MPQMRTSAPQLRDADLALEFCAQTFHPLICFSLYPSVGVEWAVEPVNVLNTLSSKPDLNTPASSGPPSN